MIKHSNNKNILCLVRTFFPLILVIGGVFVIISLTLPSLDKTVGNNNAQIHSELKRNLSTGNIPKTMTKFWENIDPYHFSIPSSVKDAAKNVQVKTNRRTIMNVDTLYREAFPPSGVQATGQTFLLLHGAAFSSHTWFDQKMNTINLLAAMGHHVVAIDLPGYGETKSSLSGDKGAYLKELISSLQLTNVVLVSPSMSGSFSIPYLMANSKDLDGYVPVAPVGTNALAGKTYNILTRTLIIYGEQDTGLGASSLRDLSPLPNSKSEMLKKAGHPAYLAQPDLFHTLLYNFMIQIKQQRKAN